MSYSYSEDVSQVSPALAACRCCARLRAAAPHFSHVCGMLCVPRGTEAGRVSRVRGPRATCLFVFLTLTAQPGMELQPVFTALHTSSAADAGIPVPARRQCTMGRSQGLDQPWDLK
ncbi:hypothetical protein NDU88_002892 [Pleurodeles waltl]|uniref:Uncharacterized protein n=1 Tax=Pleurodeles waltl TaxID=8319 RepID=A0AAV7WMH9_PLEWA|nr:hypothetical protein NDU88_002892 [Pleurodeles waltl]